MARCMKYLCAIIDLPLTMDTDSLLMLSGRLIWSASGYEESHWIDDVTWKRCNLFKVHATEAQQKLNTKSTMEAELASRCRQCDATSDVDKVFLRGSGIQSERF
jgi:hypothetical protein